MFLRVKKNKTSSVLQLVQSVWHAGSTPRQNIIASFGSLNVPREYFKEISKDLTNYFSKMPLSEDINPEVRQWTQKLIALYHQKFSKSISNQTPVPSIVDGVKVDEIDSLNTKMLGPLLPLEKAWNDLSLDSFFEANGFTKRNINSLKICVYNRLLEPVSEHGLVKWVGTTAFEDITGTVQTQDDTHYYRAGDKLFKVADKLEEYLHNRECTLLNLENRVWLYDLTNSYFEGNCMRNPRAKRSANSKEKRTDCPLLSLGLVLDKSGFPICHRVFDGNNHDCKSIPEIVEYLRKCSGLNDSQNPPTIVMDGGIATEKNLDLLTRKGYNYLVNGKRTSRTHFYEDFVDDNSFCTITGRDNKKPVMVSRKICGKEVIILCKSAFRKQKEDAIVSKTEERMLLELQKLVKRVEKNDPKLKLKFGDQKINQLIGAIRQQYTRASRYYELSYNSKEQRIDYKRNDEAYLHDSALHGCYQLRTNRIDLTDEDIWYTYITLTKIESSFRSMKSDLGLRPFYHQKDDRCETHVLITVLAYHLQKYIEYKLSEKNYDVVFPAIRRLLQTHCYVTTEVPTTKGTILIRKPGKPDPAQSAVYKMLDIDISVLPRTKRMIP